MLALADHIRPPSRYKKSVSARLRNLALAGEVGLHGNLSHIDRFGEILPRP